MMVRLSPEGSFHDRTDPGGAIDSAARGAALRCTGAPGAPANPDVNVWVGGIGIAGGAW